MLLLVRPLWAAGHQDFPCFYRAGAMVMSGEGGSVYDPVSEHRADAALWDRMERSGKPYTMSFLFAPWTLLIFAPLSCLPYQCALNVWIVCSIVLLVAAPVVVATKLHLRTGATLLCAALPALATAVLHGLTFGQPNALIVFAFAMWMMYLLDSKDFTAGCWLALATIKPQFVLVAVIAMLAARRWRGCCGLLAGSIVLALASLGLVGWRASLSYPRVLLSYTSGTTRDLIAESPDRMVNLRGLASVLLASESARQVVVALGTLLCIVLICRSFRNEISPKSFATFLPATLLASYHGYAYELTLLVLLGPLLMFLCRSVSCWLLAALLAMPFITPRFGGGVASVGYCLILIGLLLPLDGLPVRPWLRRDIKRVPGDLGT